ncbi:MAG: hypothetical protein ILP19_02465, partial [Oscillospiraceae bacterium]|nr:hypothetical protein [Oscillospiraceae bacterium]
MKKDRYRITETQFFTVEGSSKREGGLPLPEPIFDSLAAFSLEKRMPDPRGIDSYILDLEGEGKERVLRAGGYVGTIVFKDGTQFEILPMLQAKRKDGTIVSNKRVFLEMVSSLRSVPLTKSTINTKAAEKLNIFETFILAFVNEVQGIVKNGIKMAYAPYENNENFLKGKVIYAKN